MTEDALICFRLIASNFAHLAGNTTDPVEKKMYGRIFARLKRSASILSGRTMSRTDSMTRLGRELTRERVVLPARRKARVLKVKRQKLTPAEELQRKEDFAREQFVRREVERGHMTAEEAAAPVEIVKR